MTGLLGYQWRVGDVGAERAERLDMPRWSVVGRHPTMNPVEGPQVVLTVSANVALGQEIATIVVDALNMADTSRSTRADLGSFGETATEAECAFGADLYDLLVKHEFPFPKGRFFGRSFVIMRAIEAIREEAEAT